MIKNSNKFIKPKSINYTQLINVWVDEKTRIEYVQKLLLTGSKDTSIQKLKYNPLYKDSYEVVKKEADTELEKIDNSLIWSRRYQKKHFYEFTFSFGMYCLVFIPYIFYKILHKRILEQHVKNEYKAENLTGFDYWNLDFKNKDIYPDSVIKLYFDMKSVKYQKEIKEEKIDNYNKEFIKNITNGYVNDMISRRTYIGFNDDEEDD